MRTPLASALVLLSTAAAALVAVQAGTVTPAAAGPVVALAAPPMGWNSWNRFGCGIDENLIRSTADAIVANNLDDLGYRYVNIDDCWMASTRDAAGRLRADPVRFPSGIRALADYVHARGLKLGIYSSAGTATCQGLPASLDHEVVDAQTFAGWEVDYLKYDNCNNQGRPDAQRYKAMGDALKATGRPIVYGVCNWGLAEPWLFGPGVGGSLWRTTDDINDSWGRVLTLLDQQAGLEAFARPGQYNDPDMLEVGNGGMTTTEYTAHFSLWALLSAPLLLGNDLRTMSGATLGIIRNADVVAVNQDWGGSQGRRLRDDGDSEVWAKPMSDGSVAVVLLNRGVAATTVATSGAELGLGGSTGYALRNLWTGATSTSGGPISATVPSHGVVMYRVSRTSALAAAPAPGSYQVGAMTWLASSNGWGPAERNRANGEQAAGDGAPLTVNGSGYTHGIGAHADSAVHLYLGRACPLFTAQVGIDDEVSDPAASARFQVYGDGRLLAYTGVKTASQGATSLTVSVGGYATLELRTTDARTEGNRYDHADWGNATVTCTAVGTGGYASDRTWGTVTNGWGPAERDQSNGEQAGNDGGVPTVGGTSVGGVAVGGVSYVKAIGTHAAGDLTIPLGGSCERFTAVAGIDAETGGQGSVVFSVVADGVTLFTSPVVTTGTVTVNLDVTGRGTLRLVVATNGNPDHDHADWADARLLC